MKRRIRLTESDLHRIVNRSVKRVLKDNIFESSMNDTYSFRQFRNSMWNTIDDALKRTFREFVQYVGDGWEVTNPNNEEEFIHITFGD